KNPQARRGRGRGDPGGGADVGECAVPVVAPQAVGRVREERGRAAVAQARLGLFADGVFGEVHFYVIADVQVEEAVAVHVAPGAARAPMRVVQAGGGGDVAEAPAAVPVRLVVPQDHAAPVRHQQVVEAVVVVVAHGAAHAEAGPRQAD